MICDDPTEIDFEDLEGIRLLDVPTICRFVTAGRAVFTLKSEATGAHYTYRIKRTPSRAHGEGVTGSWYVTTRSGGKQDELWTYMGLLTLREEMSFFNITKQARIHFSEMSSEVVAFGYFLNYVLNAHYIPPRLQVWHAGRCGKCGRPLTDPNSIARAFGPECWARMGQVA